MNREESTTLTLSPDGKLRWAYDYSLYRNPVILTVIWRIFFFIILGMYLLMLLLETFERSFLEAFKGLSPVFAALAAGMIVLSTAGYLLYALIMGGKYSVLFEMDQQGVKHMQLQRQFEKAQLLSFLSALAGGASGSVSAAAPGFNAALKRSTYSKFKSVRAIDIDRRHQVIKIVTRDLIHNQVYAQGANFDQVESYILAHIPAAAKIKRR